MNKSLIMRIERKKDDDPFDQRYVIVNDNGKIIDDAQGWGYKSKQKAAKAMWYKFSGGKQKIEEKEANRKEFFKQHPGLERFIDKIYEYNFKEIAFGEVTNDDILAEIKEEFGIDMPKEFLI